MKNERMIGNLGEIENMFITELNKARGIVGPTNVSYEEAKNVHVLFHNGLFHADDVVTGALIKESLDMAYEKLNILYMGKVVFHRSRDAEAFVEKYKGCYYLVADVGGGKYDHHSKEREAYPNGVKMSALGKILRDIPEKLISERLKEEMLKNGLYALQAKDNGQKEVLNNLAEDPFTFVHQFNENWKGDIYSDKQNENFETAVNIAQKVLQRFIANCQAKLDGEDTVLKSIAKSEDGIATLNQFVNGWQSTVIEYNKDKSYEDKIKFVIFKQGNEYRVSTVPIVNGGFGFVKGLKEEWRGRTPLVINKDLGIEDAIFCHPNGFIGGAESYESALKMAKASL